jgi:hypothetical protein
MIGTKDATPLVFWQNDAEVGRIDGSNIALGLNAFVSNYKSVSIGVSASASGPQCIAIGLESKALQDFGIAVGMNAEAQTVNSISIGALTRTKGDFSTAIGVGAFSFSFDEVQFQKGTDYGALSASDAQPTDRKFNIGNHDYITGTAHDVFTILKNGQTAIGGFDNFETTTNPAQLQVNGSIASNTIISAAYLGSNANGEIIAVAAPVATLTGINQYKQFTATAAQTAFTLPTTPLTGSDLVMYRNGVSQSNTTYTVTGTAVTYTGVALTIGDRINFQYTK